MQIQKWGELGRLIIQKKFPRCFFTARGNPLPILPILKSKNIKVIPGSLVRLAPKNGTERSGCSSGRRHGKRGILAKIHLFVFCLKPGKRLKIFPLMGAGGIYEPKYFCAALY
jgi:hypothetical protein